MSYHHSNGRDVRGGRGEGGASAHACVCDAGYTQSTRKFERYINIIEKNIIIFGIFDGGGVSGETVTGKAARAKLVPMYAYAMLDIRKIHVSVEYTQSTCECFE